MYFLGHPEGDLCVYSTRKSRQTIIAFQSQAWIFLPIFAALPPAYSIVVQSTQWGCMQTWIAYARGWRSTKARQLVHWAPMINSWLVTLPTGVLLYICYHFHNWQQIRSSQIAPISSGHGNYPVSKILLTKWTLSLTSPAQYQTCVYDQVWRVV